MKLRILGGRTTWIILAAAMALSVAAGGLLVRGDVRALARAHQSLGHNLAHQLARAGHLALLAEDRSELRQITRSVLQTNPIIGGATVHDARGRRVVRETRDTVPAHWAQQWAATTARVVASSELPRRYATPIPPPGEGTTLDPFGTPRADVGRAVLTLSAARWRRECADAFFRASQLSLLIFVGLLVTSFTLVWFMGRPMARLRRRLRELTGAEFAAPQWDIDSSLAAIDARLARSEDRARQASEALRNREADLDRARRHAQDAARLRADMLAGMSHELRTPLTAIMGHTDMLAETRLNNDQQSQVATINKSARHLLGLLDNVLEWSGLETGRTSLDEVVFNVAETIEDTVSLLAPMAYEKGLELVHLVYQDVPIRLRGDPLRFQQILTNLVSNAIKFTASGSIVVRAMLEQATDQDVQLRVSVADTGPGISATDKARLFTLYERLDESSSQTGSGMGLAISKRLVELMGGWIDVESAPGQGAEFHFVLPLRSVLQEEAETGPGTADLAGCCVWLVEALTPARKALRHQLEAWRATVVEMAARADLQRALSETTDDGPRPDVVLLGLPATDAEAGDVGDLLERTAGQPPIITLVSASDSRIHDALETACAARSLPKSVNRLRLHRALCAAAGFEAPGPSAPGAVLAGVQTLVAEDSPANQRYLAAQLTELGADVATAADGDEAITAWQKGSFPLVFADDRMPSADGPAAFERIRAMAGQAAQPILVGISADAGGGARHRFMEAGADACLVKPFDADRIAQQIGPLLPASPPPASSAAGPDLTTDPEMARLLAQELPQQVADVTAAIAGPDLARARESAHTLHGTAAFYRLDELKTSAGALEDQLAEGRMPGAGMTAELERAAQRAQDALEQRAGTER